MGSNCLEVCDGEGEMERSTYVKLRGRDDCCVREMRVRERATQECTGESLPIDARVFSGGRRLKT